MSENYFEDDDLAVLWGRALQATSNRGKQEASPLIVSLNSFGNNQQYQESHIIRNALDTFLTEQKMQSVQTVATTIFPESLWNPNQPRSQLFTRYAKVLPNLKRASSKNRFGLYFERMITGGPAGAENQIEFILSNLRNGQRRSAFQIGIFNPSFDHTNAAQRGFPCLQHITFVPTDGKLNINAFYATQYIIERAYGNYVGLCNLGRFLASEMGYRWAASLVLLEL